MKKIGKVQLFLMILGASFFYLFILSRLMGWINYYSISTSSNEPTLMVSKHIISSNLVSPKHNEMICFAHDNMTWIFRLVAKSGDKILMKQGLVYVNGKNIDSLLNLKHAYKVPNIVGGLIKREELAGNDEVIDFGNDTLYTFLPDKVVHSKKLPAVLTVHTEKLHKSFPETWNYDNFGELIVPANHFFVLGDNRHNAMDSRIIGFISEEAYQGSVIKILPF